MWVPSMAMTACSWLSFFHRTILAALAPTILKETGLTAQQFASINAYFFVTCVGHSGTILSDVLKVNERARQLWIYVRLI
jgi:hypothetical protein